jgi:hypothetical protein
MSGTRVWIDRQPVIEPDEAYTTPTVLVPNTNTDTLITTLQIRWGKRCWLVGLGSSVDAGGIGFITFSLRKNFMPMYPFHAASSQWGSVTSPIRMMNSYEIPQGSLLQIWARLSGAAADQNAAGRLMVEYEDF